MTPEHTEGTPRRGRGRPAGGVPVVDREALLDVAERVIARDGSGASLEAIAAEAGVTKPIVYARIGSRADVSDALAARLSERLLVRARAEVQREVLDREALTGIFRATLETIAEHRALFLYVTRGSADDSAERTLFLAGRSALPLAELLTWWREARGADPAVATTWAHAIVGMLNLVALWWLQHDGPPVGEVADHLAELVWPGLSA